MGFFNFLNNIGSIFGQIAQVINAIFVALWNAMIALFQFIWNTLVTVVNAIVSVFKNVGKFFARSWSDYLKPAIRGLFTHVIKLFDRLHRLLSPLLKWIQKIRKWYDTHILPMLLKEIQMIQKVRQFLAVLRILHVKWAQVLDDKLLSVQSKITQSVEFIRGYLNLIINWIALITDPRMIIRRNTLGAWLLSHLGLVKRIAGYGGNKPISAADQASLDAARTRYYTANVQDHLQALALTGPTQQDLDERAAARTALEEAIGSPLPV
jgi:hypothetical protein